MRNCKQNCCRLSILDTCTSKNGGSKHCSRSNREHKCGSVRPKFRVRETDRNEVGATNLAQRKAQQTVWQRCDALLTALIPDNC